MHETENSDVITEDVAPTVEQPHYDNEPQEEHSEPAQVDDKEKNFAALRQRTAYLEEKLEQQNSLIESLAQKEQARSEPQPEPEVDELDSLDPDEWLTKSQFEKLAEKKTAETVRRELAKARREELETKLPKMIADEMPDFDSVVSQEALEYLKNNKPYLARSIAATSDPYEQAKDAYQAIRDFYPGAQVAGEKKRIEKNQQRPGSLDAVGSAPAMDADPLRMSRDKRERYWKELQQAARG